MIAAILFSRDVLEIDKMSQGNLLLLIHKRIPPKDFILGRNDEPLSEPMFVSPGSIFGCNCSRVDTTIDIFSKDELYLDTDEKFYNFFYLLIRDVISVSEAKCFLRGLEDLPRFALENEVEIVCFPYTSYVASDSSREICLRGNIKGLWRIMNNVFGKGFCKYPQEASELQYRHSKILNYFYSILLAWEGTAAPLYNISFEEMKAFLKEIWILMRGEIPYVQTYEDMSWGWTQARD